MLEWFKTEFLSIARLRERFWHWCVVRAIFLMWFGYTLNQAGLHRVEMVLVYFGKYLGAWCMVEGMRGIFFNPVKEKIVFNQLVDKAGSGPYDRYQPIS